MRALGAGLVVLLSSLAMVVVSPGAASACSCVQQTERGYVRSADVVASGTVVKVDEPRRFPFVASSGGTTTYLVAVDEVYKGRARERLEFESEASGASCGVEGIEADRRFVFFLEREDRSLRGSLCGGTGNVTVAEVRRLLPPVAGQPVAGGPVEDSDTVPRLVYAGVGGVVLVAGVAWWLRRRRGPAGG